MSGGAASADGYLHDIKSFLPDVSHFEVMGELFIPGNFTEVEGILEHKERRGFLLNGDLARIENACRDLLRMCEHLKETKEKRPNRRHQRSHFGRLP